MFLHIDPSNGLAVYDQIVRQIKFSVADKVLLSGELIPSVRELARELGINPNTVARAYQNLQSDGVVEQVRGTGLSVAAGARRICQTERKKLIRQRIRQVFDEAARSGLELEDIEKLIRTEIGKIAKK